jgi:hypothetical protein
LGVLIALYEALDATLDRKRLLNGGLCCLRLSARDREATLASLNRAIPAPAIQDSAKADAWDSVADVVRKNLTGWGTSDSP